MRKSSLLLLKKQNGVAMLIVALSLFMIIGFTALVVDVGGLYLEKSMLQKALDAAVLGGAQELKSSDEDAVNEAIKLAAKNGITITENEVTTGTDFIEIQKTVTKELTFARILGFNQTDINATARAEIKGALMKGDGVIPVGLEKIDYKKGASYALNDKPGEGNSGNYGYLAIDGDGANSLGEGIKYGTKNAVEAGKEVNTEPGQNWGKVEEGFDFRLEEDKKNNSKCSLYETADNTCKRVVILPLIETFDVNGKSDVMVVGFAAFWIESISKHEAKGKFIEIVRGGSFGPGENFGIYGVKLVN